MRCTASRGVLAIAVSLSLLTACGGSSSGELTSPLSPGEVSSTTSRATTPTTVSPATTTIVPGRRTSYTVTAENGYAWRITAAIPTVLSFSKHIADSPPGKARMSVRAVGNPTGTITGATPGGRNTPPSKAVLAYADFSIPSGFPLAKVTRHFGVTNAAGQSIGSPLCEFLYSSSPTVFRCRLDIFGFFASMPPLPQPDGIPIGMDKIADEYAESELDALLGILKNQQPTFTISGGGGTVGSGIADRCLVQVLPNGTLGAGSTCKISSG